MKNIFIILVSLLALISCDGEDVTPDMGNGTNPGGTLTVEKAMEILTQPNPSNGQGVWQDVYGWDIGLGNIFYNNLSVSSDGTATWSQEIPAGFTAINDPTPQCGTISFRPDPERAGQLEMVITPTGTFSSPETCESQRNSTYMYFGSIPAAECGIARAFLDMRNGTIRVSTQSLYLDVIKLTESELRVNYTNANDATNSWLRWRKDAITGDGSVAPNEEYVWTR